jgi:hypothetical protein
MTDPPRYPDTADGTGVGPDREPTTRTPRWVKVFGIISAVVVLVLVILLLLRNGHGPSRHTLPNLPHHGIPAVTVATDDRIPAAAGRGGHTSPQGRNE